MEPLIQWLQDAPLWQAVLVLLAENALVFLVAVALGNWLVYRFAHRRVSLPAPPLEPREVYITASNVLLNTLITLIGLFLWRWEIIRYRTDVGIWAWLDVLVLLMVMDVAMYVLHRIAHHSLIFAVMHRMHHEYDRPRPLTLFILNPVENLSFGMLWLIVTTAYTSSWLVMSVYLTLNVVFGTIGHLGVEPLPAWWSRVPMLRNIAGATFHARHHQDVRCNFGFYTVIWDRIFGTLRADYWESMGTVPEWVDRHEGECN